MERLTRELAQVRVEKAGQRKRIDQLQVESSQLQRGDGGTTSGTTLQQKKEERDRIRAQYSKSQEQYQQLKQGIGLLGGEAGDDSSDGSLQDDLNGMPAESKDFLQSLWGSMENQNGNKKTNKKRTPTLDDAFGAFDDNAGFDQLLKGCSDADDNEFPKEFTAAFDDMDNDTVITEQTKDSLQIAKARKHKRGGRKADVLSVEDDNDTVITEQTKDSLQIHRARRANRPKKPSTGLGNFLDSGGKDKPSSVAGAAADGGDGGGAPPPAPSAAATRGRSLGDHFHRERTYKSEDGDMRSANE